jgi:hypothetical protein
LENRFGDSAQLESPSSNLNQTTPASSSHRPNTSSSSLQGFGSTVPQRAQTAVGSLRPKSPPPAIQLKLFSKEKIEESLSQIKV